ncbi:glycosyltransferase family 4 protein [Vulcanisaeta thermophila]|uniref:glycosyltransferase family 4 protein n=1 Tax=Vulcanisaeta thermophila TaxID=867917 RepID=UPI000852BFFF|nr:glycosyltransferase family 4 protein [Vulcanisaeta thermophila]
MRVCILEEFTRMGGGQVYALQLSRALRELGHGVRFIVVGNARVSPNEDYTVVKARFRASYDPPSLFIDYLSFRKLMRELNHHVDNCDLVINNHPNFIPLNPGGRGFIVMHGLSFVDFIIDEWGNVKNEALFWFLSRNYRLYDGANYVYNSRYTMNLARRLLPRMGINAGREYILSPHYTVNIEKIPEKEDYVLTLGRLEWNKGLRELMHIAREIRRRIIVAGKTDARESKEVIRRLSTISNIEVMPDVDERTKEELYKGASIYLHLNRKENFGIAVLDAVASGTIPITPRSGAPWTDILEEGRYGLGYTGIDEVPKLIEKAEELINREEVFKSRIRYSPGNFRERLRGLIKDFEEPS